jgi:hypothetical protein
MLPYAALYEAVYKKIIDPFVSGVYAGESKYADVCCRMLPYAALYEAVYKKIIDPFVSGVYAGESTSTYAAVC